MLIENGLCSGSPTEMNSGGGSGGMSVRLIKESATIVHGTSIMLPVGIATAACVCKVVLSRTPWNRRV